MDRDGTKRPKLQSCPLSGHRVAGEERGKPRHTVSTSCGCNDRENRILKEALIEVKRPPVYLKLPRIGSTFSILYRHLTPKSWSGLTHKRCMIRR